MKLLWVIGFWNATGERFKQVLKTEAWVFCDQACRVHLLLGWYSSCWPLFVGSPRGLRPWLFRSLQLCLPDNKCLERGWRDTNRLEGTMAIWGMSIAKFPFSKDLRRMRCTHFGVLHWQSHFYQLSDSGTTLLVELGAHPNLSFILYLLSLGP